MRKPHEKQKGQNAGGAKGAGKAPQQVPNVQWPQVMYKEDGTVMNAKERKRERNRLNRLAKEEGNPKVGGGVEKIGGRAPVGGTGAEVRPGLVDLDDPDQEEEDHNGSSPHPPPPAMNLVDHGSGAELDHLTDLLGGGMIADEDKGLFAGGDMLGLDDEEMLGAAEQVDHFIQGTPPGTDDFGDVEQAGAQDAFGATPIDEEDPFLVEDDPFADPFAVVSSSPRDDPFAKEFAGAPAPHQVVADNPFAKTGGDIGGRKGKGISQKGGPSGGKVENIKGKGKGDESFRKPKKIDPAEMARTAAAWDTWLKTAQVYEFS